MESNWTKAEFRTHGKLQGVPGELVRLANETLAAGADDQSFGLSADFGRRRIPGRRRDLVRRISGEPTASVFGLALVRPDDRKLMLVVEHSVLLPLVGIALGAKAGYLRFRGP